MGTDKYRGRTKDRGIYTRYTLCERDSGREPRISRFLPPSFFFPPTSNDTRRHQGPHQKGAMAPSPAYTHTYTRTRTRTNV